jgi:ankyrin repeat protein
MISSRFRWVSCQLEALRHCFPANLRHALMDFPKSLDETYMRILKEIKSANRKLAYRLFQCLVVAGRPLRVEELAEVLAFDFNGGGIPKLNAGWRWEDQQMAVLSACSSLVAVVVDNGSRVVQFSHFSVKEFLTSDRLANSMEEVSQFHIPIEPCHVILARACLGVLLHLDDCADKASIEKIPLLQYAAEYWYQHVSYGKVESQTQDAMNRFFDTDKPHFSAWVRIQDQYDLFTVSESEPPSDVPLLAAPAYFAARMGFHGLVEHLIRKHPQQVNRLGGLYGTPLHASVLGGHTEVAQVLFAHGADINSRTADNWTPLHFASQEGHLEVGKWLLNLGAVVDFQNDGQRDTPLHLATSHGHLEVARLLLERNAEVNSRNSLGSTPLLNASANGNPDVVLLLLDYNADVHLSDKNEDTPLHFAAIYGHLKVARLLITHRAEVNSRNILGYTPLLNALANRKPDVVRLLLDNGADVQSHNQTTSEETRHPEQEEIAQLLSQLSVE